MPPAPRTELRCVDLCSFAHEHTCTHERARTHTSTLEHTRKRARTQTRLHAACTAARMQNIRLAGGTAGVCGRNARLGTGALGSPLLWTGGGLDGRSNFATHPTTPENACSIRVRVRAHASAHACVRTCCRACAAVLRCNTHPAVPCCAVLCYAVPCHSVLCCAVLCCTTLQCTVLSRTALQCTVLN